MENKPYLIFSLHGLHYGVDALLVQEIFHLPELTQAAEAPDDIVGLLNLHSKILPVMHLGLRLGYQPQECRLSDSVIVLEWEGLQIGIIVNLVHEVKNIHPEAIFEEISYERVRKVKSQFIAGVAQIDANIIMLLDHKKLLRLENQFKENHRSFELSIISSFYVVCCPNATPEEKAIFQQRALDLSQSAESSDFTGLMPLVVISLNGEYFGLDLEVVREFTNIRNVTPIPCCPAHIVGNINLRGEIVTLVDIRSALNMPCAASTASKAIVIHVDDLVAGLPVDEVFDVMYLRSSEVRLIPAAVHSSSNEFLLGTAPYFEKMLSILDLPKILIKGGLIVHEEV